MYKTVRHGENSLQYTILPQTEEVLNNSGLKGKGRDYSPSIHVRRSRKTSTLKYVSLVLLIMFIALAIASVPLYVMDEARTARRNQLELHHAIITTAPLSPAVREKLKASNDLKVPIDSIVAATIRSYDKSTSPPSVSTTTSTIAPPIATNERATTPPWTMPALRSWKSTTTSTTIPPLPTEDNNEIPLIGTPSGSIRMLDRISLKPWEKDIIVRPTVTPEPITLRSVFRYYSRSFLPTEKAATVKPKIFDDVLITTKAPKARTQMTTEITSEASKLSDLKDALLSVDDDDDFKESLEVDEVFSLPPMKPDFSGSVPDDVIITKPSDWYAARWPFVDTSSYFQWTGYSPGDNLLLPLLVAALSSVALVLLLTLAVRRRKRTQIAAAQLGLPADMQADDNTNLLTPEPQEHEEAEE